MTSASFNAGEQKADLNQYWYSDKTIHAFVQEILEFAVPTATDDQNKNKKRVAFLSCPSVYFAFPPEVREENGFRLFEFDKKWESDPGFVFYDFNKPSDFDKDKAPLAGFDYIVVDPPFITKEVWAKYIETVKLLGAWPSKEAAAAAGVAHKPCYRVLFTTVIENHSMLEDFLDQPLFIPHFRPTVVNLTYQYNCFINYPHVSGPTGVSQFNEEIPREDGEQAAARRMANDMRESEVEFLVQMRERKRDGETKLPAPKEGVEAAMAATGFSCTKTGSMEDKPIADMKWGHVPDGLTEYAGGAAAPEQAAEVPHEAYGAVYMAAMKRRELLDLFKKTVDVAFKKLDGVVIVKESAAAKGGQVDEAALKAAQANLYAVADETGKVMADYAALCQASSATDDAAGAKKDQSLLVTMKSFVTKLADESMQTGAQAKEVAIDATRNFKSPAFNRQKELLQVMKTEKKKYVPAAGAAGAAAAEAK